MSYHQDYERNTPDYGRMPRYELDSTDGSGRQVWALVAIIAIAVLLFILVSGFGRTTVEHPGGATAPAAETGTAPAADDATRSGTAATGADSQ